MKSEKYNGFYGRRHSGLTVSALDSESSAPGSSPGWGLAVLCSWAKQFTLTVPLSTQVYKWTGKSNVGDNSATE